jgi:hypothetical protein
VDPAVLIPGAWYVTPEAKSRLLRYARQDGDGYIFSVFKGTSPEDHGDLVEVITIYNVTPLVPWTEGPA